MTEADSTFVPLSGQSFSSEQDWINRATRMLTCHPNYHNTEHDGPEKSWLGLHFTAMCFDQKGRRVRNGGDFRRAKADASYPVWWIWPDQIAPTIMTQADRIEALEAKLAEAERQGAEKMRERAARELAHHLTFEEDVALSEIWQERIRALPLTEGSE